MTDDLAQRVSSSQNFRFLAERALLLAGDAVAAEAYADADPDAAMAKARRFSETLTKMLMRRAGLDPRNFGTHFRRIEALAQAAAIPEHVRQLLHDIRQSGNQAVHEYSGNRETALSMVQACFDLGAWWYQTETGQDVGHRFMAPAPTEAASLRELIKSVEDQITRLQQAFESSMGESARITATMLAYSASSSVLVDFYVRRFAGRRLELQCIKAALASAPGYLLIEAPSGFGKSALAAQLVHRIHAGNWDGLSLDVIYFFVRAQRKENTATTFLRAVNPQLMDIAKEWHAVPTEPDALRAQFDTLWSVCVERASAEQPLLLLIDGLDEVADEREASIIAMLPDRLGPFTHVLVTSRPNPVAKDAVPPEHPLQSAQLLRLGPLTTRDIVDLLANEENVEGDQADLAARVFNITRGEPLFVRYVCEEIVAVGVGVLIDLEREPPSAVRQFFKNQFSLLSKAVTGDLAWRSLAVLAIAHGPLTLAELADILGSSTIDIDRALRPIMRHLAGDKAFEIPHPRLRDAVEDYLGAAAIDRARHELRSWGIRYEKLGWPYHTPAYLTERYIAHLDDESDYRTLVGMACPAWMQLKMRHTGSYRAFADDVLTIAHAARERHPPDITETARSGLILAILRSSSGRLPSTVLEAMTRLGDVRKALDHADLQDDPIKRAAAFSAIARGIGDSPVDASQARRAVQRAEDAVGRILDSAYDHRREYQNATADLVAAFCAIGDRSRAEKFAQRLATEVQAPPRREVMPEFDYPSAANALSMVGDHAQAADLAGKILQSAARADDLYSDLKRCVAATLAYARAGQLDKVRELAHSIRSDAKLLEVEDECAGSRFRVVHGKEHILRNTAKSCAIVGDFEMSTLIVSDMAVPWQRGKSLIEIAEIAAREGRFDIAAKLAAKGCADQEKASNKHVLHKSEWDERSIILGRAASVFATIGQVDRAAKIVTSLIQDAVSHTNSLNRDRFLLRVATALAPSTDGYARATSLLGKISDSGVRRDAMASCAAAMAEAGNHTDSSVMANALLIELANDDGDDILYQRWNSRAGWPTLLARAFTLLSDSSAVGRTTDLILSRMQQERSGWNQGDLIMLLELAADNATCGREKSAKRLLKLSLDLDATTGIESMGSEMLWARAARVKYLLGATSDAERYAHNAVRAFTSGEHRSYIPALVTECAQILTDANLAEYGRSLLLALVSRDKEFKGMLMGDVASRTKLFEDLLGAAWVRDYLNAKTPKGIRDYTHTLHVAQGWFNLKEFEMANKVIKRIIDKRPRPGTVDEWTRAILQSAQLLLLIGEQEEAFRAYAAAIERHLAGNLGTLGSSSLYWQFISLLGDATYFFRKLPDGTQILQDVAVAVAETETWLRNSLTSTADAPH